MSALLPKAEMCSALAHVRFGPLADIIVDAREESDLIRSLADTTDQENLSWSTAPTPSHVPKKLMPALVEPLHARRLAAHGEAQSHAADTNNG